MAPFGKKGAGTPSTPSRIPAVLRVGAVSRPSKPSGPNELLMSGMLLGPGGANLPQFTVVVPPFVARPSQGMELRANVDSTNLDLVTLTLPVGVTPAPTQPSQNAGGWDPGPGGGHNRALADWLAAQGFLSSDFGPTLVGRPGLADCLDQAAARYVSVVPPGVDLTLTQSGEPVQGQVTAVQVLPFPAQLLPSRKACMTWLTLAVTPQFGSPYPVTIRMGFSSPQRFAQLATIGTRLPLRRDPDNRMLVTIDAPPVFS
jgi:hypothetical protein